MKKISLFIASIALLPISSQANMFDQMMKDMQKETEQMSKELNQLSDKNKTTNETQQPASNGQLNKPPTTNNSIENKATVKKITPPKPPQDSYIKMYCWAPKFPNMRTLHTANLSKGTMSSLPQNKYKSKWSNMGKWQTIKFNMIDEQKLIVETVRPPNKWGLANRSVFDLKKGEVKSYAKQEYKNTHTCKFYK